MGVNNKGYYCIFFQIYFKNAKTSKIWYSQKWTKYVFRNLIEALHSQCSSMYPTHPCWGLGVHVENVCTYPQLDKKNVSKIFFKKCFFYKSRSLKCLFNSIIIKQFYKWRKKKEEKLQKQREENKKKQDEEKEDREWKE